MNCKWVKTKVKCRFPEEMEAFSDTSIQHTRSNTFCITCMIGIFFSNLLPDYVEKVLKK